MNNILDVQNVKKYYELKTGLFQKNQYVKAVDDFHFLSKKDKHLA